MLYDSESTSCRHRLPIIFLFKLFTSSTSQCCPISINIVSTSPTSNVLVYSVHPVDIAMLYDINQHRVDIDYLYYPCLHHSHSRHHNVVRYRINIVSTYYHMFLTLFFTIVTKVMFLLKFSFIQKYIEF